MDDAHAPHRWEDDGGKPHPGCLCQAACTCATQAERDAAARQVVAGEPYTPHFASPPAKPHAELPEGETYRRMIDGG